MAQYAEITYVGGPDSAPAGSVIVIPVQVVNRWHHTLSLCCTGDHSPNVRFFERFNNVPAGETWYVSGIFYMPVSTTVVAIRSWWQDTNGNFHLDDEVIRTIQVTQLEPAFSEFRIIDYFPV